MHTEWADAQWAREPRLVWEPIKPRRTHLNAWVRDAHQRFAKNFGRLLKATGLIASEWAALRELYRPQRWSPVALGQTIGMSKGGASKLVNRLVKKGLAVKDSQESDRRFRSVGLTQRGRELVVFLAAIEKDTDREFFGPLGNCRRFRLTLYTQQLLDFTRHLPRWIEGQLKRSEFQQFAPTVRATTAATGRTQADEFWAYCQSMLEANALGKPAPVMSDWMRAECHE